jgi:hypothetical protein
MEKLKLTDSESLSSADSSVIKDVDPQTAANLGRAQLDALFSAPSSASTNH